MTRNLHCPRIPKPLVDHNYIQSLLIKTFDHLFAFCYWDVTFDPLSEYLDAPGMTEMPELASSKSMEILQMESRVWNEENPFDLTLFPYALAKVCPDWKLILFKRPYWTRVVLSVDYENPTPLEDPQEIFRITAPRLLEVSIGHYHAQGDDDDPDFEKEKVKGLTDLLLQNHLRCRKISIDVHSHASVPEDSCFEGHPRPSNGFTLSMVGKGASITHSWCDEIPPLWR